METHKLRYQKDLQTCISVTAEPKKLSSELLQLRKRHLDKLKLIKWIKSLWGPSKHVECLKDTPKSN